MLTPFERGLIAHLVADWILQNDWMATHKGDLRHPAGWVHTAIHVVLLGLALGWLAGLVLGLTHLIIDTRAVLNWWQRVFRQTTDGRYALHVAIWGDQVLHITVIAIWVSLASA